MWFLYFGLAIWDVLVEQCSFLWDDGFYLSICMQAVADIIRTTLGPRSMLKMLLDAAGGAFLFVM